MMSSKVTPAKETPAADDFKVIKGIGPGVEQRLHAAGILSYVRLAALSPADIAALTSDITGLSTERIIKQGWIEQARKLASDLVQPGTPPEPWVVEQEAVQKTTLPKAVEEPDPPAKALLEVEKSVEQTAGVSFKLEFELDALRQVNQLRLVHEQSGVAESWKNWEQARLIEFIEKSAALHIQPPEVPVLPALEIVTLEPLVGTPKLISLTAISVLTGQPVRLVSPQQSFELCLGIDLSEVIFPEGASLDYQINLYAKQLGNPKPPQLLSELTGNISSPDEFSLKATADGLDSGIYRLEATLILTAPAGQSVTDDNLKAMIEGNLLQVY